MNREEFDKLYLGKAVHCDTEEKANEFLALADSVGYKWRMGKSFIEKNRWEIYEEKTCYKVAKRGFMYADVDFFKDYNYEFIKYQLQPKFKLGDTVRIKDTPYIVNGKVGVIVEFNLPSPIPYGVKFDNDRWLWFLPENELEKVEEPTYKEETIDDIIEEIKERQKSINVLLNRLESKVKVGVK